MKIQLSDHFNYNRLLRFTFPSIVMIMFTSIYGMVDGFFISNYVGKTAFASVNLIIPYLQIIGSVGAMLGVGGSALVAKTLGEGDKERSGKYFSMIVYVMIAVGLVTGVLGIIGIRPMAYFFGATEEMVGDCATYGAYCLIFNVMYLMQCGFQSLLIVAEKPKLGLLVTVLAGCTNMVLDYVFMGIFRMGIHGAGLATGLTQTLGCVVPLFWFMSKKNKSALQFCKTKMDWNVIGKASFNGVSEMLSNASASITGILFNMQLMKYAGENGVAAYGVVMYASFIFVAMFMGYSSGSAPIMGYHYGAQNHKEMKNVLKRSMVILASAAVILTTAALLLADTVAYIFVGYDRELMKTTERAFTIYAIPFFIMWFNIYTSSFFTALNDGAVSAAISFMRALVLPVTCILILPMIWELDGVWYAMVASEVLGCAVALFFMLSKRKKYKY